MKLGALFAAVACLSGLGTYFGASALGKSAPQRTTHMRRVSSTTPTAAEFGRTLVATTSRSADGPGKLTNAHCVQASPGHYMCSYAVVRTNGATECHLMQGRWTPEAASTITVTLAGRTNRCATLRDALQSLG